MLPMPAQGGAITTDRRDQLTVLLYGLAGGFGDATSLLRYNTFTGHVTGNLVFLMVSASQAGWSHVMQRLVAIVMFLAATRAGFRIGGTSRATTWLYTTQVVLLFTLLILQRAISQWPTLCIALFCITLGLQNGVITSVHNVSLHSTFISGDFTKLLKPAPKGTPPSKEASSTSPLLLRTLIAGFATGALVAAWLHRVLPVAAFIAFLLVLTLAYLSTLRTTRVSATTRGSDSA